LQETSALPATHEQITVNSSDDHHIFMIFFESAIPMLDINPFLDHHMDEKKVYLYRTGNLTVAAKRPNLVKI